MHADFDPGQISSLPLAPFRWKRIALTPLFTDDDPQLIPTAEIQYAFTVGAVGSDARGPQLLANWISNYGFDRDRVYMRLADGIYQSRLSSLEDLIVNSRAPFVRTSVSVAANVDAAREADLFGRPPTLGFVVLAGRPGLPFEHVVISKTYLAGVGAAFGIPPGALGVTPAKRTSPRKAASPRHCAWDRSPASQDPSTSIRGIDLKHGAADRTGDDPDAAPVSRDPEAEDE